IIFYKNQPTYNPQKWEGELWKRGGRKKALPRVFGGAKIEPIENRDDTSRMKYPKSIITISNADRTDRVHPTQKPVALFEYLIRTYTNEGETVLDNCMGSGTTAIACMNTERNYVGFELDETYYEKSLERVENHRQQLNLI
ncbi:cytosine methyltransferase, partial [Salmonella enterica subsp. enterica serovar Typhimurium]|uniref:DNA-methyltransferase n=1 Tax=Salmonella enterica TaxID=28901 RepID=UPI000CABEA49